eukprot:6751392-Karenia_brevis.AAC.1
MCIRYKVPQTKYHRGKLRAIYADLEKSRDVLQKLRNKNQYDKKRHRRSTGANRPGAGRPSPIQHLKDQLK